MNTDGRPKGASPRLRHGFFGRPKRKILNSSKRTSLRRMREFGRFIGEEAEIFLWISHTKGVKGDFIMKSVFDLTIHDLGVERNEEQNKALRYAWLTWVVFGALFLFFVFGFSPCL